MKWVRRRVLRSHPVSANPFLAASHPFRPQQTRMGPVSISQARCAKRRPEAQKAELTAGLPGDRQPKTLA